MRSLLGSHAAKVKCHEQVRRFLFVAVVDNFCRHRCRASLRAFAFKGRTPEGPGVWQLYNLALDPGETYDLAQAEPTRLAGLLDDWNRYVEETGVPIVNIAT